MSTEKGSTGSSLIQPAMVAHGGLQPDDPGYRGQADYTPGFLAHVYDPLVLKVSNRFMWRTPTSVIERLYDKYASEDHLDVGPGTGYLLDRCRFPSDRPKITLLDVNRHVLDASSRRIARYNPSTYQADLLRPLDLEPGSFGSIGLTHVLHCLPGTMSEKGLVIEHLRPLLRSEGVLFGTTVLTKGVRHTPWSSALVRFLNFKGVFSNQEDDASALEGVFASNFTRYSLTIHGPVAIFVGYA